MDAENHLLPYAVGDCLAGVADLGGINWLASYVLVPCNGAAPQPTMWTSRIVATQTAPLPAVEVLVHTAWAVCFKRFAEGHVTNLDGTGWVYWERAESDMGYVASSTGWSGVLHIPMGRFEAVLADGSMICLDDFQSRTSSIPTDYSPDGPTGGQP